MWVRVLDEDLRALGFALLYTDSEVSLQVKANL